MFENFKRIWFDLLAFFAVLAVIIITPAEYLEGGSAKVGLAGLFLSKFLFVTAGFIHGHITRKLAFPYINFKDEKDWSNNLMIIAIYVIFIFGWTRGG